MDAVRNFFVPGQPQGKGRARVSVRGGFARAYTPEKTEIYENLIKAMYLEQYSGAPLMEGPLRMCVTAVYTIPKSTSGARSRKMLAGDIRPTTKPDIDNLLKCLCDAGNGIMYKDDTQIVDMKATKSYGAVPGVYVSVYSLDNEIPFTDPHTPDAEEFFRDIGREEE
jgi:Holliday junction resolvase RusA-like endonuclease